MIEFSGKAILLDIEGTTSSVSFVYDVMFPFVRRELAGYLKSAWGNEGLAPVLDMIAVDAGAADFASWSAGDADDAAKQLRVQTEIERLMDGDIKATGLKQLQGKIWKSGFDSGELVADIFDDVPPALVKWNQQNLDVRIYSSGSIAAQKMFFGHTRQGDLLANFQGHYDTTTGGKKEAPSYQAIAADYPLAPSEILFLSDVVAELDAAQEAGMQTGLCLREGNKPVEPGHGHAEITSFDQVACC
ncbi:MAG: acireductone synthase [Blastopirellula sp.]|nr:MAG: acireductone synthase [Blastopirellula sp.]